jgi:predicted transposase/invertase (TIGR01784 family)
VTESYNVEQVNCYRFQDTILKLDENFGIVKTDTLFYQIFQTFPQLVFQLLDRPVIPGYAFTSVEVKEKSFRFDGIFMPPPDRPTEPIYFIEVQFQPNANFYRAFLSEIFLYLNQQQVNLDWIAVAIFPNRKIDISNLTAVQEEMIATGRIVRIYLDEINDRSVVEFGLLKLITCPEDEAVEVVNQIRSVAETEVILEFIETILVYKFPRLTRKEIEAMFALDDLRQTRVYQETLAEGIQLGKEEGIQIGKEEGIQIGKQEEASNLLIRLIRRKFGEPDRELTTKIASLPLEQLESLGEELLDFQTIDDLTHWLDNWS